MVGLTGQGLGMGFWDAPHPTGSANQYVPERVQEGEACLKDKSDNKIKGGDTPALALVNLMGILRHMTFYGLL